MKLLFKVNLILIISLFCLYSEVSSAQVSVVANKSITAGSIDINTLVNLFTIQSNEIESQKVSLFFLNENNDTDTKFLSVMGKSLLELKKIWLKAKLTGNGKPPEMITTASDMLQKVISTPGAIGFIDSKSVNGNVKVLLKID